MNLYTYVANSPMMSTDPYGEQAIPIPVPLPAPGVPNATPWAQSQEQAREAARALRRAFRREREPRYARVVVVNSFTLVSDKLGPAGREMVHITTAEAIEGIDTADKLVERLGMRHLDHWEPGVLVMTFELPEGVFPSPVLYDSEGNNEQFIPGGNTAGGAPEFLIPNLLKINLIDFDEEIIDRKEPG